jgi:pimeloyl-ACP methyl ester carboxylesterase
MLNYLHYPSSKSNKSPLLIIHGLYGSARNWGVICKRMSDEREIFAVDQRNHGDSQWCETHDYFDMAEDIHEFLEYLGSMAILGHSMGGKAAMVLSIMAPKLVEKLIIADIAPVSYSQDNTKYIRAMKNVKLDKVTTRGDAIMQLAETVPEPELQSFFAQSLDLKNKRWKLNLDVLEREMEKIVSFPQMSGQYDKASLFVSGALSNYLQITHRPVIKKLFPKAEFATIENAGHWLHAEKPREFEAAVRTFLNNI